jgi:hypothetical protein
MIAISAAAPGIVEAVTGSPSVADAAALAAGSMESAASSHAPFPCVLPSNRFWEEVEGGVITSSLRPCAPTGISNRDYKNTVHCSTRMYPSSCELRLLRRRSEGSGISVGEGVGEEEPAAECCGPTGCQVSHQQQADVLQQPGSKRQRLQQIAGYSISAGANPQQQRPVTATTTNTAGFNPIDHIFQFHKALKQELYELEQDASLLEAVVIEACQAEAEDEPSDRSRSAREQVTGSTCIQHVSKMTEYVVGSRGMSKETLLVPEAVHSGQQHASPSSAHPQASPMTKAGSQDPASGPAGACNALPKACTAAIQQLGGRFQFLWGIYQVEHHQDKHHAMELLLPV